MNDYTPFLSQVLNTASASAMNHFGKVATVSVKAGDHNQVLTETDVEIGKLIISNILEQFPTHNIIDEEAGVIDKKSEYTWVIDPIDGTSNFAVGSPSYGIIIGLLKGAQPIVGGVALPFYKEIITAEKGKGAFCNGAKLTVSKEEKLLSTLVAYSIDANHENPEMTKEECKVLAKIVLGCRNLRAAGSIFDGVLLAKGKYGGYLSGCGKIWDNVGAQVIVEEAGGVYTDFWGKPMDYSNPLSRATQNFTMCAGSKILHDQLQKIIHS